MARSRVGARVARRAVQAERGDEEEDASEEGVAGQRSEGGVLLAGLYDEGGAGDGGQGAAGDHRPLAPEPAPEGADGELDEAGGDGPGAPDAQDRRDAGCGGDGEAEAGEGAEGDVQVQAAHRAVVRPGGPDVDDGARHVEQGVDHQERHAQRAQCAGGREEQGGPYRGEREAREVQLPQGSGCAGGGGADEGVHVGAFRCRCMRIGACVRRTGRIGREGERSVSSASNAGDCRTVKTERSPSPVW